MQVKSFGQKVLWRMETIFLVQALDMEDELAFADHLVIEFVPSRKGCEFRSREYGKAVEVKTIACQADKIDEPDQASGDRNGIGRSCQVIHD
jgi:hypothetical protein